MSGDRIMINQLAIRLKQLREDTGLTQKQVAERIGCKPAAVGAYEQGVSQPPADILMKLAKLYKTSADYILGISFDKQFDMSNLTIKQSIELTELVRDLIFYLEAQNGKPHK